MILSIIGISQNQKYVDPLSVNSLKLELYHNATPLSTATGFIVKHNNNFYLITNWHVLSGIEYFKGGISNKNGLVPNKLVINHHAKTLGQWIKVEETLYDKKKKLWIEIKTGKTLVDVVALRLRNIPNNINIYPFDLNLDKTDMIPVVAMPASIIGFPHGGTGYGVFPIWKTGHIASDPDLDYLNLPVLLIDATTKPGMSGSPVVLRLNGGFKTRSGNTIMSQSGLSTIFLGIYSGQDSLREIGWVWKSTVIRDLLKQIK